MTTIELPQPLVCAKFILTVLLNPFGGLLFRQMSVDDQLRALLRELSASISRSLSSPENLIKLEKLQHLGYDLYLILEPSDEVARKLTPAPIGPMAAESHQVPQKRAITFQLSEEDKDFLRTLKIKVD